MTAACRKSPNTATPQSSKRSQVRYGVKHGHSAMSAQCPDYPRKRTSIRTLVMSQKCHVWTSSRGATQYVQAPGDDRQYGSFHPPHEIVGKPPDSR